MSLYHEAAKVLDETRKEKTSIKSLVHNKKDWKSDPKTLFALSTEAAKWSEVLSEVVERSGVLKVEKSLKPTLALVLIHDLFLFKKGIALPASHGLNVAVSKHKVRLSAELTKARLRRGCATLDTLRVSIDEQASEPQRNGHGEDRALTTSTYPRWVRINTLRTTLDEQLDTTFAGYVQCASLNDVLKTSNPGLKTWHQDAHIPNLIAIPAWTDITSSAAYRKGELILQDKASCFPAYLLDPSPGEGDVIDACAAPGNKTTHLAAILSEKASSLSDASSRVIACEKDTTRSQTLEKMVKLAGDEKIIKVKAKQDFMKLKPEAVEFANVTSLLLDPSCSGSGIVGRDEGGIQVHLPSVNATDNGSKVKKGKKRKRTVPPPVVPATSNTKDAGAIEEQPEAATDEPGDKLATRLANLSAFQLRLLEHAMSFPAAKRIAYSTCSIHAEENEHVVVRALSSVVAQLRGWTMMRRAEQVEGLREWKVRGLKTAIEAEGDAAVNAGEVAEACIRCEKGSEEGTMGFFLAGFVRDHGKATEHEDATVMNCHGGAIGEDDEDSNDEWNGFDDET